MGFGFDDLKNAGDLKAVWDNLREKDWNGLKEAIEKVRQDKGDNESLQKLEGEADKAQGEGKSFPQNPGDLMKLIGR